MASQVTHWEIMGPDGDGLKTFYSSLFGWNLELVPGFDQYYTVAGADAGGNGGAVGKGSEDMPSYLTIYLGVDDVAATLSEVEAAGGRTIVPRTEIPQVVTFAMFADPAGNIVGLTENE